MRRVLACLMVFLVSVSFAQVKPGGSVTALISSQHALVMGFGGGFTYFVNRYFGGGVDLTIGMKRYEFNRDFSTFAIDGYFAPRVEFDRGRIFPIVGITVYSLKEEVKTGSTTDKYNYGASIGSVFGLGVEVHFRKQIVFGTKIKNRMVTSTLEGEEVEVPIGGTEIGFMVGLLF